MDSWKETVKGGFILGFGIYFGLLAAAAITFAIGWVGVMFFALAGSLISR